MKDNISIGFGVVSSVVMATFDRKHIHSIVFLILFLFAAIPLQGNQAKAVTCQSSTTLHAKKDRVS
jgi:hypothetical protein